MRRKALKIGLLAAALVALTTAVAFFSLSSLEPGEALPETLLPEAAVNVPEGEVYFYTSRSRIVQLDVGQGATAPTLAGHFYVPWREWNPPEGTTQPAPAFVRRGNSALRELLEPSETVTAGVLDNRVGHFYFYSFRPAPGRIIKIDLTTPGGATRNGHVDLDPGPGNIRTAGAAVIDLRRGYALVGTARGPELPADIVKVALTSGAQPPRIASTLQLDSGEANAVTAVIDEDNGYAYFGVNGANQAPARIVKVEVGDDDSPPRHVGSLVLDSGERRLEEVSVIDAERGFAYFGAATRPGRIIKVALGEGDAPPTRVGFYELESEAFVARIFSAIVAFFWWIFRVGPPGV